MSQGCCPSHAKPQPAERLACPQNGQVGRTVSRVTVAALLRPEARRHLRPDATYWFCPAAGCDTVYYTQGLTFSTQDLAVPVWQKRPGAETPVCYCFDWTVGKIQSAQNPHAILEEITRQVRSGNCYCDVTNPQGACCLGNVGEAIRQVNGGRGSEGRR